MVRDEVRGGGRRFGSHGDTVVEAIIPASSPYAVGLLGKCFFFSAER